MVRPKKRRKSTLRTSAGRKRPQPPAKQKPLSLPDTKLDTIREKRFEIVVLVVILAFGVYKSIALWGAYPIPNPDFPGFIGVGKSLLSFQVPQRFKRAPVVGIFQVLLTYLLGPNNELNAGWLLNAILAPLNIILIWRIGKRFIGNAAIFLAIVAMLSPWVLRSQVNPIAETTMIFFILITFLFIFKHSNWAYVFASIAAIVRYECTVLILIAFLMDIVTRKTNKQRLLAFCWAAFASVPFLLWMLGTYLNWNPKTSHYIGHYSRGVSAAIGIGFIDLLWQATYMTLLQLPAAAKAMFVRLTTPQAAELQTSVGILFGFSKIVAVASLLTAFVYGVCKRHWNTLALFLFLAFYILVHAMRPNSHHRYCVPVSWMILLLSCFGIYCCWKLINTKNWMPSFVRITFQVIIVIIAFIWLIKLAVLLPKLAPLSVKTANLSYVAIATVVLIMIAGLCFFRTKFLNVNLAVAVLACLMIVSHHFTTIRIIGNGDRMEFKLLADWFLHNTEPGERLASRYASSLCRVAPTRKSDFIYSSRHLKSKTLEQFIEKCRQLDVTYVTWSPRGSKGSKKGLLDLAPILSKPTDIGPLKFIERIQVNRKHWVNIFRLRPEPASAGKTETGKD